LPATGLISSAVVRGIFPGTGVAEDFMRKQAHKVIWLCCLLLPGIANFGAAQEPTPPSDQPPANVAGKWTIYANDPNGTTSTKYIDLVQDGEKLSGKFKGPYASGGLEGTIHLRHIVFKTKTRDVLTFRGQVEGEKVNGVIQGTRIRGNFHAPKGTGTWQAVRTD